MTQSRIAVVWNPSKTDRQSLEEALESHDVSSAVFWFETSEDDPGQGAAESAISAGADVVIAAGGDGTIRAVIEHLAESTDASNVELGIIPMGTGNLLARNLELPLEDIPAAFEHALHGEAQAIDVGSLTLELPEGKRRFTFAVMAGFGLDANMIAETDDDLKDKVGWLAYVESLGRAVSASKLVGTELVFDNNQAEELNLHTLIVGNCGTLQGGLNLLPDADLTDGELDAVVLSAEGVSGWMDTVRNMVWQNGVRRLFTPDSDVPSNENTEYRRLQSLTIKVATPQEFEVDGDPVGEAAQAEIAIQPAAIKVRL